MLAHFTNDFYANFLPVYLPLLREKFGLSLALVGLLSSTFTTAASFLQLGFGVWADRDRGLRRNFALWGPLITGAFMSVVGVLPSYGLIVGALLLAALGTAMFHPQATALSGRLLAGRGRRGLAVSLFIGAGTGAPSSPEDKGLKGLAVLWGLVVLRHVVLLSFLTFLVILLQGRGYGYLAGSFALVGFLLVSAPAGLLGGLLSDRPGARAPPRRW